MQGGKIIILLVGLVGSRVAADLELVGFADEDIRPQLANGTVSEHISYMVSLRFYSEEINKGFGYGHFCGGVLISRQHILTLASCLRTINPIQVQVVAGTRMRYDDTNAKVYHADKIVIHPDYVVTALPNNVALIFLSDEISTDIASITAAPISGTPVTVGQKLQFFGWGTPLVSTGNRELQTGGITVVERDVCPQTFINRFCAGPNHIGGCRGDDGGAVASNSILYGLVDYRSSDYCSDYTPAHLYVDVVAYRDWIKETIGTGSSKRQTVSILAISIAATILTCM